MFGGASTLIGTTPQLTANALLMKMADKEMTMWDFTGLGLLIFAGFLVYLFFFGFKDGKKIWKDRKEILLCTDASQDKEGMKGVSLGEVSQYDKKKIVFMTIIIIFMMISYIFTIFPTAVTAMIAAMSCILTGLCTADDVVKKLHWQSVIFLASCLDLGNALTISGAGELVGNTFLPFLGI